MFVREADSPSELPPEVTHGTLADGEGVVVGRSGHSELLADSTASIGAFDECLDAIGGLEQVADAVASVRPRRGFSPSVEEVGIEADANIRQGSALRVEGDAGYSQWCRRSRCGDRRSANTENQGAGGDEVAENGSES
ncbi:hypothetical protein C7B77_10920 [Chamaesiphon polymorphus CCALA 037]|uniref:Uncharacterized protein n=1 Tax=Chamaesiphon polymorphus CCALA 037 TaxID=2107692 RepID=A0A2T1GGE7_9CYAN|nr:hypothetical protein C7B77_10920 [Chamaesiphon polymorphus CCALA 037]